MTDTGRSWVVPGYTELRPLGGGAFGEVVVARQDTSGLLVAVKYLHPDLLSDPEHVALFRAEAQTLRDIDDPHVVHLFDYLEIPAGAAIVMELVEGVTLAKLLARYGKTTPESALVVLYGSLLGLAAAHARGVVHRDYKPANVLVNGFGASKLTDFGIAALAGDQPVPAGTLRYMPPEQFEGTPASPAGDVYAATVTFYECLTGVVPFDGTTADEVYDKAKTASAPLEPVPEPLRPVIARGLAKSPQFRPSDAGLLAAELRAAAVSSYGADWEEHGRSHLAEAALLLLALLWPSGSTAVTGTGVEQVPRPEPGRNAADKSRVGRSAGGNATVGPHATAGNATTSAHANAGNATASPVGAGSSTTAPAQAAHADQVPPELDAHQRHEWHLRHEREEHIAHLRAEDKGHDTTRRNWRRYRPRNRLQWTAAGAGGLVVVAAVAGIAAAAGGGGGGNLTSPGGGSAVVAHATSGVGGGGSSGSGKAGFAAIHADKAKADCASNPDDKPIGKAALPVTATSLAESIALWGASCVSTVITSESAYCNDPVQRNDLIRYACAAVDGIVSRDFTGWGNFQFFWVNVTTGAWYTM